MYAFEEANAARRMMRRSGESRLLGWIYARTLHHLDPAIYRLTRGRATFTSWVTGLPIVLLTTTGAKSGARRTLPLVAIPAGDRLVVIASNYGRPHHPAWYHNLKAHPRVTASLDGSVREMSAFELEGDEREHWFRLGVKIYPGWVRYTERTAAYRRLPVIELTPV